MACYCAESRWIILWGKMISQRRKAFTIQEKGAIICRLERESNYYLAKEFEVGHSTISNISKNKNRIKLSFAELLSWFVHSHIEYDSPNSTMAMSPIQNSIRNFYYNTMRKQRQTKITDFLIKKWKIYVHTYNLLSAILFWFFLCYVPLLKWKFT